MSFVIDFSKLMEIGFEQTEKHLRVKNKEY